MTLQLENRSNIHTVLRTDRTGGATGKTGTRTLADHVLLKIGHVRNSKNQLNQEIPGIKAAAER